MRFILILNLFLRLILRVFKPKSFSRLGLCLMPFILKKRIVFLLGAIIVISLIMVGICITLVILRGPKYVLLNVVGVIRILYIE